ncbi:glycoside hydrolase family 5 protein [Athelia psychrophila]|uniref:mannan endo-1,4-beta-mannosidase n=1 Tax=Athelia psychrophila TaxID=1759441 RepID=A0A166AV87_9AGAM|nr:glycoside hydrolase family 5 protein [Fibularhizoctonia sp. CBS 109695]
MRFTSILPFVLGACSIAAQSIQKRDNGFITTQGQDFYLNGSVFKFIGTNAYWLPTLTNDQDLADTFSNMSAIGIKVVRTWAFNDVTEIPVNGTWFQLIANGTTQINNGTNGLARLDKVVELAQANNIHLILSLTNNWNPLPGDDTTQVPAVSRRDSITGNDLNRNYLSNDYGGMDAYVREFGTTKDHDEFYTSSSILGIFNTYVTTVVTRYKNSPAILAWEIANDPRCNSTLPTGACTPQTVTEWHSTVAKHVKSVDPNHVVSSGSSGFFCTDCKKLFPPKTAPPPPTTSKRAGDRRQPLAVTKRDLIRERSDKRKKARAMQKREGTLETTGLKIRGRWAATPTRRQSGTGVGSDSDGSQGVDSEDILGIPEIGFSSFQLFPDQDTYDTNDDPSVPAFNQTVDAGVAWIQRHAAAAAIYGKPTVATGFGLVTTSNAPDFVPFNSTEVSSGNGTAAPAARRKRGTDAGVTDDQRDDAYRKWLGTAVSSQVNGMVHYQWGQTGLTGQEGTPVSPAGPGSNPTSTGSTGTAISPNDGYSSTGVGQSGVDGVLQQAGQQIDGGTS